MVVAYILCVPTNQKQRFEPLPVHRPYERYKKMLKKGPFRYESKNAEIRIKKEKTKLCLNWQQCDLMSRLFAQYLADENDGILPNDITNLNLEDSNFSPPSKILPKCQNFAKSGHSCQPTFLIDNANIIVCAYCLSV